MKYAGLLLRIAGTDKLAFQRRDDKAPTDPNVLALFGGGLEAGETPLQAAYRELHEETSLLIPIEDLRPEGQFEVVSATKPEGRDTVYLFSVTIPDANFEVYEGVGCECYTVEELLARTDVSSETAFLLRNTSMALASCSGW